MDGGSCSAAIHGVAEGQTRLRDFTFTFHFHALEKEMATHSSILAYLPVPCFSASVSRPGRDRGARPRPGIRHRGYCQVQRWMFQVSYAPLSCTAVKFARPGFAAATDARTYSGSAGMSFENSCAVWFSSRFRLASSTSRLAALQALSMSTLL